MKVNGEETVVINGESYWTVRQFSKLTGLTEPRIRALIYFGNSQRKLNSLSLGSNKPMIKAKELFDFPFVSSGRPPKDSGVLVTKFYLKDDKLYSKEVMIEK